MRRVGARRVVPEASVIDRERRAWIRLVIVVAAAALGETIQSFRADELAHRQTAIEHGATEALGYELISAIVKTGSRLAIWLSTRL